MADAGRTGEFDCEGRKDGATVTISSTSSRILCKKPSEAADTSEPVPSLACAAGLACGAERMENMHECARGIVVAATPMNLLLTHRIKFNISGGTCAAHD
jgi:hypothetical protein